MDITNELIERIAAEQGKSVEDFYKDVEELKAQQPPSEIEILKEENIKLQARVQTAEETAADTSLSHQELLELLIDLEVL